MAEKQLWEIILNCDNCKYNLYAPDDMKEERKCRIVGKFSQYELNPNVRDLINKFNIKNVCEYFDMLEFFKKSKK